MCSKYVTLNYLCLLLVLFISETFCQDDDDGPYKGKHIGKINSYHHQVSGNVYAVDEYTFLFVDFNYDGNGGDTFFWAGSANRPGPQGFIVPDEHGVTNILERYFNKEFTLTLPDNKKISDIKWLAIYDINNQNSFGDIYIPEDFEAPAPQKGGSFVGKGHNVASGIVEFQDAKTIVIPEFSYDGAGEEVYFWMGVGPQPSSKGQKVPDEYGYLDPIRAYNKENVILEIPGDKTIFNVDWLSVYDVATKQSYGSILIPDGLNVPPSLVSVQKHTSNLPNCVQLHKDYQVSWEVFGPQITFQLAGQVTENGYMSFGVSGSEEKTQMLGADVAVAYMDGARGFVIDYNISALAPCVQVLGQYMGVCKDDKIGAQDSYQMHTAARTNGINVITFRRTLSSSDTSDREYVTDKHAYFVWAMGKLDHNKEPTFHDIYPKGDVYLHLGAKEPINTCFDFTSSENQIRPPWDKLTIFDSTLRTFSATIGPAGGLRGYQGITKQTSNGHSWYINGLLAPELYMKRGLTYAFKVYGGNNPHSAEWYHPFIITADPHGGFDQLSDAAQKHIRVLAGVEFTRRGRPRPTTTGPLCLSKHPVGQDRRLDDDYATFRRFNRTLELTCEEGNPGILEVTPNTTWPDTVYYNSFTHSNMGWKIHIVDRYSRSGATSYGTAISSICAYLAFVIFGYFVL